MNNTNLIRQLAEEGMRINGDNPFDLFVEDGKIYQHHAEDLSEPWNPLTDWNDCMGLVGEINEKNETIRDKFEEQMSRGYDVGNSWTNRYQDITKEQICMAAAKALGIDVE